MKKIINYIAKLFFNIYRFTERQIRYFWNCSNHNGDKLRVVVWSNCVHMVPLQVVKGVSVKLFDVQLRSDATSISFQRDAVATVGFCSTTKIEVTLQLVYLICPASRQYINKFL